MTGYSYIILIIFLFPSMEKSQIQNDLLLIYAHELIFVLQLYIKLHVFHRHYHPNQCNFPYHTNILQFIQDSLSYPLYN